MQLINKFNILPPVHENLFSLFIVWKNFKQIQKYKI
jgi:hypothetical protein